MKLSIFTTISDPETRGDMIEEPLNCYKDLADEVVIVEGSKLEGEYDESINTPSFRMAFREWPKEFDWQFIGQQFQMGYEEATGDWVIHSDIDWLFHQKDFGKIRQAIRDYPTAPAISFYKWQFLVPDKYNLKSRLVIAVNKKAYGDRIKFDSGGDLCQPSLDGKELRLEEMPQAGVPFYCYEKLTKTQEQIADDVGRMDRAWHTHFGDWLYSKDGSDESAYEGWLQMMTGRLTKPHKQIPLSDHPKYVQETLKNLRPDQWGYNGFNNIEVNSYAKNT